MQLTAEDIRDLAEMAGFTVDMHDTEPDQEFTVERCPKDGVQEDDGSVRYYRLVAYDTEYWEEGVMPLGPAISEETHKLVRYSDGLTVAWRPISEAPKDEPLWLFSEDFRDDDFNPSGVVDGFWNDDTGWTIWKWNGCHDCYDTVEGAGPTHFAIKKAPEFTELPSDV